MGSVFTSSYASAAVFVFVLLGGPAQAETPEIMMAMCRSKAHEALKVRMPEIDTKYEGQRTDGSHAVNGTAFTPSGERTFQCSFNKAGSKITNFVVNKTAAPAQSQGATPSRDEQACLQAVSTTTNNGDVATLRVETSEANTTVIVGVGPKRAPWKCLASKGVVAEVMSITDEGRL
ncbi:hypothetical protein V5F40_06925 [Xanthobacter sp. DSM 14520]|uniref:hypothetical protein n=1 Tax=Xanthobacter autotrophicus (strain ATCC BAA-1158 / Py2) TaxID=78245 RepID=UPI00372BF8D6